MCSYSVDDKTYKESKRTLFYIGRNALISYEDYIDKHAELYGVFTTKYDVVRELLEGKTVQIRYDKNHPERFVFDQTAQYYYAWMMIAIFFSILAMVASIVPIHKKKSSGGNKWEMIERCLDKIFQKAVSIVPVLFVLSILLAVAYCLLTR